MPRPARLAPLVALACLDGCASTRATSSCSGCRADVVIVSEPPASGPAPSTAAPGAQARAACEAVLAHNRRVIAAAPESRPEGELDFAKACFPVRGGAWAFRLLEWRADPDGWEGAMHGRYELVYARDGLAPEAVALPNGYDGLVQGMSSASLSPPAFFDFDGDGEPEIFVRRQSHEHEGPSDEEGLLLTSRGGRVRPYPGLPAKYNRLDDVDQDGRPDLVYYPYAEERESPCSGFGYRWLGPAFVAHSLPGGAFSTDDAFARDFARRSCPARPKAGAPPHDDGGDAAEAPPELCARIWGASEAESLALLKRQCKAPASPDLACQDSPGVCFDFEDRAALLKAPPPFALRE
ncbi:MAG TPA: VCBS repeat-containing protein [Polyangiaceae bacterium]|nr:VCBS repeat-containing protein [Polyangiaceae bacterium]